MMSVHSSATLQVLQLEAEPGLSRMFEPEHFLFAHINQPEFQFRHRWNPGGLLMWDNRFTQHYAASDYLPSIAHAPGHNHQ